MANKGRTYAENLVGALDRSAYNQQRDVAKNVYSTNWQNIQNQYKNLQDKLKLQQQRANAEYAEGLVDVAENAFNRQRLGSADLSNRGLSASGLTNILNQADTAQKGEEISKLLNKSGNVSLETADKLSQGTTKFANEGTGLLGKLADTLGNIGDAETDLQNRYNQTLAGIAGAMEEREMNNALQAAQRAANRAGSGRSKKLSSLQSQLEEAYRKAGISEVLSSDELTDQQKANYLGIMYGINDAGKVVNAYNSNANAAINYHTKLKELEAAAEEERKQNKKARQKAIENAKNPYVYQKPITKTTNNTYNMGVLSNLGSSTKQNALDEYKKKIITYEDLAALLYGNK